MTGTYLLVTTMGKGTRLMVVILDSEIKIQSEKREYRALTAMVDKRLGWTMAQKKHRTVKKRKSKRREYRALTAMRWGEVGQGHEKSK